MLSAVLNLLYIHILQVYISRSMSLGTVITVIWWSWETGARRQKFFFPTVYIRNIVAHYEGLIPLKKRGKRVVRWKPLNQSQRSKYKSLEKTRPEVTVRQDLLTTNAIKTTVIHDILIVFTDLGNCKYNCWLIVFARQLDSCIVLGHYPCNHCKIEPNSVTFMSGKL